MMDTLKSKNNSYVVVFQVFTLRFVFVFLFFFSKYDIKHLFDYRVL